MVKNPAGGFQRFEVIVAGTELVNAFSELNDPVDQRERFLAQAQAFGAGDEEAHPLDEDYINALGAMSGGQAVQMAKAGLKAIYLSGWQVAGDANLGEQVYPDQSLYPANSAPALVRRDRPALFPAAILRRKSRSYVYIFCCNNQSSRMT